MGDDVDETIWQVLDSQTSKFKSLISCSSIWKNLVEPEPRAALVGCLFAAVKCAVNWKLIKNKQAKV